MAQLFTIKPDDLSLICRTHTWKERTDSCNTSSYLYTCDTTNLTKFSTTQCDRGRISNKFLDQMDIHTGKMKPEFYFMP